jgi:hypothetical protein
LAPGFEHPRFLTRPPYSLFKFLDYVTRHLVLPSLRNFKYKVISKRQIEQMWTEAIKHFKVLFQLLLQECEKNYKSVEKTSAYSKI